MTELISFLDTLDFDVLELTEVHHAGGTQVTIQLDFVFVKRNSFLIKKAAIAAHLTLD